MVSASGLSTRPSLLQVFRRLAAALGLFHGALPHKFQTAAISS